MDNPIEINSDIPEVIDDNPSTQIKIDKLSDLRGEQTNFHFKSSNKK